MDAQDQTYERLVGKPWHPKTVSDWTVLIGGMGLIALSLFCVGSLIHACQFEKIPELLMPIIDMRSVSLFVGIFLVVAALVGEAISRIKVTPPATWRVQNELARCLIQLGLLNGNDTRKWVGMFSVAPMGRWDTKTKRFSLAFMLRHAKATEKQFSTIEESIAAFTGCRDAAIEINNKARIWNMKLVLWYGDDPYGDTLSQDAPW